MDKEGRFASNLYKGAAGYYDRYRPDYPRDLIEALWGRVGLTPEARVLDLACGTGQVSFALAPFAAHVLGIDQEPDMISLAKEKAEKKAPAGSDSNVTFRQGRAESLVLGERFHLITVGNAFHRFDRVEVASRMKELLLPGGFVALLWNEAPWRGEVPWQKALRRVLDEWRARLDTAARVPPDWRREIEALSHEDVLAGAGLDYLGREQFLVPMTWSLAELVGFVYSTSDLGPPLFGGDKNRFESGLERALGPLGPSGNFSAELSFAFDYAQLPE